MAKREIVLVPVETALVFDRDGWHLRAQIPQWVLDELEPERADAKPATRSA